MKKEVKINKAELKNMLLNWNFGAQPVSIQYLTSPKINKDGKKLFGDVVKIANVGGMIGYDYENSVNLQLIREGKEPNFKRLPLWNGKGIHKSTALVEHVDNGNEYLSYKYQQTFRSFLFDSLLNPITNEELKEYFYKSSKNQYFVNQNMIEPRTVKLDNIRKLKFKKTTYIVT